MKTFRVESKFITATVSAQSMKEAAMAIGVAISRLVYGKKGKVTNFQCIGSYRNGIGFEINVSDTKKCKRNVFIDVKDSGN